MIGFHSNDGLFCLTLHEASASLGSWTLSPKAGILISSWRAKRVPVNWGNLQVWMLRHACIGRNLSPWLYFDLLLAFVSSEYYHGANHSLTFKFSLLINSHPGGKQYLLLTLTGSSNSALGISALLLPLWRVRPCTRCTALTTAHVAREWNTSIAKRDTRSPRHKKHLTKNSL